MSIVRRARPAVWLLVCALLGAGVVGCGSESDEAASDASTSAPAPDVRVADATAPSEPADATAPTDPVAPLRPSVPARSAVDARRLLRPDAEPTTAHLTVLRAWLAGRQEIRS